MGYSRSWIWSHQARSQGRFGDCERVSSHNEYQLGDCVLRTDGVKYESTLKLVPLSFENPRGCIRRILTDDYFISRSHKDSSVTYIRNCHSRVTKKNDNVQSLSRSTNFS